MSIQQTRSFAAILIGAALFSGGAWSATLENLWSFSGLASMPTSVVSHGGALYGTTVKGGAYGYGAVFQIAPPAKKGGPWSKTVIYSFTNGSDGAYPSATLAFDAQGNLYGNEVNTCSIFQLTPPAAGSAWSYTLVYNSSGSTTGCAFNSLTVGGDGAIYFLNILGYGSVIQLTPPASPGGAWSESVMFALSGSDGSEPGSLVLAPDGTFYGTLDYSFASTCPSCGGVFQLTPPNTPGGSWTETLLYSFAGGSDGETPSSLALGSGGVLYGTTSYGGSSHCPSGCGTVYELAPPASPGDAWTKTVLYDFATATAKLGGYPANLLSAPDGALYGVATGGVVFGLAPPAAAGDNWTHSLVYKNSGAATSAGASSIVLDSLGHLDGVGSDNDRWGAQVFRLTAPASQGTWRKALLYDFATENDASNPNAFVFDSQGTVYGVAQHGGLSNYGGIFQLVPPAQAGQPWSEALLYSFTGFGDGAYPVALIQDQSGTMYGVATGGGGSKCVCGTVFRVDPPAQAGGAWKVTTLYVFSGGADGSTPVTLAVDSNGTLYGVTKQGGIKNWGTVFQLQPPSGTGAWTKTSLYAFQGTTDGEGPYTLTWQNGVLYGATFGALGGGGYGGGSGHSVDNGTVFQLTPPAAAGGAWTETVLRYFAGGSDGTNPSSNLVFDTNGAIYGATAGGGTGCLKPKYGCGIVYQLVPPAAAGSPWTENILYSFRDQPADGSAPGSLVFNNGSLVGASANLLFQLTPAAAGSPWTEALLQTLTGESPGALTINNGALFGVTASGPTFNGGVFELTF